MKTPLGRWLKELRKYWQELIAGTAWIASVTGSLMFLPILGETYRQKVWLVFAQVITVMIIGQIFLFAQKYRRRRHARYWSAISMVLLGIFTVTFYQYQEMKDAWTVESLKEDWIVGPASHLTDDAKEYIVGQIGKASSNDAATAKSTEVKPELPTNSFSSHVLEAYYKPLLESNGHAQFELWRKDVLQARWRRLAVQFSIAVQVLAISIICLMHAIFTGSETPRPKPSPRAKLVSVASGVDSAPEEVKGSVDASRPE